MKTEVHKGRQHSRQARQVIAWGLLALGLVQAALALQIHLGDWRYQDRSYEYRLSHLRRRMAQSQVQSAAPAMAIFLGSSAVANGLKGTTFEQEMSQALGTPWLSCNLSVPGAGPLLATVYLHRVLREGLRPDLVVVETHPVVLSDNTLDEIGTLRASHGRFGIPDLERLRQCGMPGADQLRRQWFHDLLFPCYAHRFSVLAGHGRVFLPPANMDCWAEDCCDPTGWAPIPSMYSEQERRAIWTKVRDFYIQYLKELRLVPAELNAVRDIVLRCKKDGIAVALLVAPLPSEFDHWWSARARKQFADALDDFRKELEVPVIDARAWMDEPWFHDPLHLGKEGAEVFTRKLVHDGLVPLYRQSGYSPAVLVSQTQL